MNETIVGQRSFLVDEEKQCDLVTFDINGMSAANNRKQLSTLLGVFA